LSVRSASRLLVLHGAQRAQHDRQMSELPQLLRSGDLLVFNDTRVLPARLLARKPTGGRVELLLERALPGLHALVQLRDSKSVRAGMALTTAGGAVQILQRCEPFWEILLPREALAFFEAYGQVPLPPYIERQPTGADRERYQSLLARVPWPRLPRACTSMRLCSGPLPRAASSARRSRYMSAPEHFSRCAASPSPSIACTASATRCRKRP
jgi:S-adenosylmethionine:tRNA ribosyltransferase-isomerase